MQSADSLQRFLFEGNGVRGSLVHLDTAYQGVVQAHGYPPGVARVLGESLAAAALLSGALKSHAGLILQVQAEGPLRLLVAQSSGTRNLRGLARYDDAATPAEGGMPELCGAGHLAITIDRGRGQRYQGLVSLTGASLAESVEEYFLRSEQLATRMLLAADGARCAGLMLQSLPGEPRDEDLWDRVGMLSATLSPEELLATDQGLLLHRLFHQEDLRVFEPERVTALCSCKREKIREVLRALGYEEIQRILADEGEIEVHCDFCGKRYVFDAVDAEALFSGTTWGGNPGTRH